MSPELREFALSLPVEVRRELLKVDGPCWFLHGRLGQSLATEPDRDDPLEGHETRTGPYRLAYLPVSPIAIALHAAKLSGMDRAEFSVSELSGHSRCSVSGPVNPYSEQDDAIAFGGGTEDTRDPTGHRAAIELLQKVMSEKTP